MVPGDMPMGEPLMGGGGAAVGFGAAGAGRSASVPVGAGYRYGAYERDRVLCARVVRGLGERRRVNPPHGFSSRERGIREAVRIGSGAAAPGGCEAGGRADTTLPPKKHPADGCFRTPDRLRSAGDQVDGSRSRAPFHPSFAGPSQSAFRASAG